MAKSETIWVGEEKASELLGLKPATLKVYCTKKKLPVRRSKATYKAKSAFHLGDINAYLLTKQIA